MRNIKISAFTGSDIDKLVDLWNKELPVDSINKNLFISRVVLDEYFNTANVLVAKSNEEIVGFVIGAFVNEPIYKDVDPGNIRCWITSMAVKKEFRKEGIGRELISQLLDHFAKCGKKECYISTYPYGYFVPGIDVSEYAEGIRFFNHFGFEECYRPLSMDANIVLMDLGAEFRKKIESLDSEGIRILSYEQKYIISYLSYMKSMTSDWYRVARHNLLDLTQNRFNPDQITIAVHEDEVIGYCQFEG
jgi:GNAT superfamily N-acetyltransferase